MPHLELSHLTKYFGATRAVHDLSLNVERGEILSILGPSGCGKTTTLRMIAGLETPTSGSISSNGREITHVPARSRNMGMVFQNYALFPHLDVLENVAFGLRTRRLASDVVQQRVKKALASVRMEDYERRSVHQLSGGQQQRIALARALAIEPEVLLLDEPLSNLDPSLREDLRDQIRNIIREFAVTTVFVTHDQQEALALGDRIAIMDAGVCRQVGKPDEVYNKPADTFVARFLGKANLLPGRLVGLTDSTTVMVRPENVLLLPVSAGPTTPALRATPPFQGGEFTLLRQEGWRPAERKPDRAQPQEKAAGAVGPVEGKNFLAIVTRAIFEGAIVNYTLEASGTIITARALHHGAAPFQSGETVEVSLPFYHPIPS